jgi:hypothetical protein
MAALTQADYVILQNYANAGKRELYFQYLELKGDIYAKRAGEVIRNDSLSAQIANKHLLSYAPAGFSEADMDRFDLPSFQRTV